MYLNVNNSYGAIKISKRVIAKVAAMAAGECYGLVGMVSRLGAPNLTELFRGEQGARGVLVREIEGGIEINLYVVFEFGLRIQTVAENVVERVKYSVELATGVKVKRINVYVESVRL